MNTLRISPSAYIDALTLPELQAELVLAASRLLGTRVVASGLSSDFYVCRECAGRGRDRHQVSHLPECVAGMVAHLLLAIAHREAERVSLPHRKEPSPQENRSSEPAQTAAQERRPFVLPKEVSEPWTGDNYGEPWTSSADGEVLDCDGQLVVDPYGSGLVEPDEVKASRRIVACVNHCKGVPTEALLRETARATSGGVR